MNKIKVVTNFRNWELNYRPFLEEIYGRIVLLFFNHCEQVPSYEYFARFAYRNTKQKITYNSRTNTKYVEAIIV